MGQTRDEGEDAEGKECMKYDYERIKRGNRDAKVHTGTDEKNCERKSRELGLGTVMR